eukprot:TRINITY_DN6767_c0_g3_i1.p1 TRINITY_DN6767_c0_g3~~TRINITY_DN6767_c0_g3_i1.p1  ORF type:complete len:381 (-),score=58.19 TRINITY_DN6767_c0_g3_i1:153-1295(-)
MVSSVVSTTSVSVDASGLRINDILGSGVPQVERSPILDSGSLAEEYSALWCADRWHCEVSQDEDPGLHGGVLRAAAADIPGPLESSNVRGDAEASPFGDWTLLVEELQRGSDEVVPEDIVATDLIESATESVADREAHSREMSQLVAELSAGDGVVAQASLPQHETDVADRPAELRLVRNPLFRVAPWASQDQLASAISQDQASACACAICLSDFKNSEDVATIRSCGHSFHLQCLQQWMLSPPFSCPTCRAGADTEAVQPSMAAERCETAAVRHGWQPRPPPMCLRGATGSAPRVGAMVGANVGVGSGGHAGGAPRAPNRPCAAGPNSVRARGSIGAADLGMARAPLPRLEAGLAVRLPGAARATRAARARGLSVSAAG